MRGSITLAGALLAMFSAFPSPGEEALDALEREGIERVTEGQAVERQVADVSERTRKLRDAYEEQLKLVQGLETYIGLLDTQLTGQRNEVAVLRKSITDVAVLERQVLPLMLRMIDSLESFVDLDVPFLESERRQRIDKLRALMGRSDVTVAEKCRRVFEAYQVEFGGIALDGAAVLVLDLEGASFDAEFLRVGRLGLLYRTVGSGNVGFWDRESGSWQPLQRTPWANMIDKGIQVARQEIAPELIHVALDPSGASR